MDRAVVEQKLESLRRCVLRIESKAPPTAEVLASDFDLQDIISLNLSRAVQLAVDIGAHLISELNFRHLTPWGRPLICLNGPD